MKVLEHIKANITSLIDNILFEFFPEDLIECSGLFDDNDCFTPSVEFYIVSDWLYYQLKAYQQPVVIYQNLFIWGRTIETPLENDDLLQLINLSYEFECSKPF